MLWPCVATRLINCGSDRPAHRSLASNELAVPAMPAITERAADGMVFMAISRLGGLNPGEVRRV
jgi:hypothetical protein